MGHTARKRELPIDKDTTIRYPKRTRHSVPTTTTTSIKPENPDGYHAVKRGLIGGTPPTATPNSNSNSSSSSSSSSSSTATASTVRYPPVRLLSLQDAHTAFRNRKTLWSSRAETPRAIDQSFIICEYYPSRIMSALPQGHSYALVNGYLVQIKLTGEDGVLSPYYYYYYSSSSSPSSAKSLDVSLQMGHSRLGRKTKSAGLSLAAENEINGQYLLSRFKERSAAIKSRKEKEEEEEDEEEPLPQPRGVANKCVTGTSSASHESQSRSLLSLFRERAALIESGFLKTDSFTKPLPGENLAALKVALELLIKEALDQVHKKVQPLQQEGEQPSPKVTPPPQPIQTSLGPTSTDTHASPLLSAPQMIDPVTSKSTKLTIFANQLASLTAALRKAMEVLPQMALDDLEGVLENDWMVEDMEKMVVGVISYVNGRGQDGERQWRTDGGSGKL